MRCGMMLSVRTLSYFFFAFRVSSLFVHFFLSFLCGCTFPPHSLSALLVFVSYTT